MCGPGRTVPRPGSRWSTTCPAASSIADEASVADRVVGVDPDPEAERHVAGRAAMVTSTVCTAPARSSRSAAAWPMRSGPSEADRARGRLTGAPSMSSTMSPGSTPAASAGTAAGDTDHHQAAVAAGDLAQTVGDQHRLQANTEPAAGDTAFGEQGIDHPSQGGRRDDNGPPPSGQLWTFRSDHPRATAPGRPRPAQDRYPAGSAHRCGRRPCCARLHRGCGPWPGGRWGRHWRSAPTTSARLPTRMSAHAGGAEPSRRCRQLQHRHVGARIPAGQCCVDGLPGVHDLQRG